MISHRIQKMIWIEVGATHAVVIIIKSSIDIIEREINNNELIVNCISH